MSHATLHEVVADPGGHTSDELLAAHAEQLASIVRAVGLSRAAESAGVAPSTLAPIIDGDHDTVESLDIEDAAAILALADEAPSPETIAREAREALLFGMTTGVMNVDVVAGEVSLDVDPGEVQGMLEGRLPMTLREYVTLQRGISGRAP